MIWDDYTAPDAESQAVLDRSKEDGTYADYADLSVVPPWLPRSETYAKIVQSLL